ncbi:hypothetical protein SEPCBS57363_002844 [Sporothrix epigloea]|uniref:Uncharacterized protein n=1 Tax=Sporothrix epigloea TaxID=1892477 RepID=A0ABP0DI59_9PEZI
MVFNQFPITPNQISTPPQKLVVWILGFGPILMPVKITKGTLYTMMENGHFVPMPDGLVDDQEADSAAYDREVVEILGDESSRDFVTEDTVDSDVDDVQ